MRANQRATICSLRDTFRQEGDGIARKKYGMVLAYGINLDFYEHLLAFMEEDYVICSVDMAIMANTRYTGHGAFLSIDER